MTEAMANQARTEQRRALISYFFRSDSIPLGYSCARALAALGWQVSCFDSQAEHPWERHGAKYVNRLLRGVSGGRWQLSADRATANDRYREKLLEAQIARERPQLLLVIRGNSYSPQFLRRMKEQYGIAHVAGWWVKNPRPGREMLDDAAFYDSYFSIHEYGYGPGDGIHHLPAVAVDRHLYPLAPSRAEQDMAHGAVLVGGFSARREHFLALCGGLPLELYGPGWRKGKRVFHPLYRHAWYGKGIWGEALNRLYHRSRLVLNITSWDPAAMSGQNLRIMDVPATGAFLLTDECPEVRRYYTPGEDIETFSTPQELRDKIRYYLEHPAQREAIARKGYERTLGLPSYEDRMADLLQVAGLL